MFHNYFALLLAAGMLLLSACQALKTGPNSWVIKPKTSAVTGEPWFMLDDNEKLISSIASCRLGEAEKYLKKGADANFKLPDGKSLVYIVAKNGYHEGAALLLKYGADQADAAMGEREFAVAAAADAKRQAEREREIANRPYRPGLLEGTLLNMARSFHDTANTGGFTSSSGSGPSSRESSSAPRYEDCVCTYDARRYEVASSGTNTIRIRSATRGEWEVNYYFGDTGFQMKGGGNLEGKALNVRWDNDRPGSLKSPYGSGYNKVFSASKY